jgi:Transposase IS4
MQSTFSNTNVPISSANETDMSLVDFLCRANEGDDSGMNHGTKVLAELVRPIANTGRVIVADSYFASVQAALTLYTMGLRFIGTVKTATRGFPMHYFQRCLLPGGKGDHKALLSKDEDTGCSLLAFVWADRDRRYFISTCLSTSPGKTIHRRRWRQVDSAPNADPEVANIAISQTECGQVYYEGCGAIDQHNRHRQDGLDLEKKVQTMGWHNRAAHSIFGMCVVDAYDLAFGCQGRKHHNGGFRFFIEDLITSLIDNKYDQRILRKRRDEAIKQEAAIGGTTGVTVLDTHRQLTGPTPTKRRKANRPEHRLQGSCMVCKKPTTHVCRSCQCFKNGPNDRQYWICNKAGKECMGKHILETHTECIGV